MLTEEPILLYIYNTKINIVTLISFLQDYPRWVHWLIAAWFLLTAVGLIVLMMARATKLPTTAEPASQSAQSQQTAEVSNSPGASIYQAGRDVVVKPVALANERAWIVLKHVTSPDDVHIGIPLKVSLTFQNVGGTPATNVQAATIVEWLPPATLPSFSYKNVQLTSSATVGPQVEFRSNLYPTKDANGNIGYLVQKDLDAIISKSIVLFTHGHVTYEDTTGRSHWTDFC